MSQLDSTKRSRLRDSAFAYVDSKGRRRLPIHDESHVRNALSRFNQVVFEDEAARERARRKLLVAARKYGIVPIGFVTGQLESLRGRIQAQASEFRTLPTGNVTFLLTDIEGSTGLLHRLGDRYAELLADVRAVIRGCVHRAGGREVDARADEFFAVFVRAADALEAALGIERILRSRAWPEGVCVRVRAGIHSGRPTLTDAGYVGLAVHATARICSAGHGGQILLSGAVRDALGASRPAGLRMRSLGSHRFHGLREALAIFQVMGPELAARFPPLRTLAALDPSPSQEDQFVGKLEQTLAEFVVGLSLRSVPAQTQRVVRRVVMAVAGTGFAGAAEDGVLALREMLVEAGGASQATVLVYGDRLPARAAAQLNGTMCRALDFCDAMAPGPHIGAALFPAALAAAELVGGCSGEEFLTALVAGAELSSRFNLSEAQYDGFDPTGIVVVFSAAAAASRILKLTAEQTLHALALAFNRCGGSFQSHVDGSLGVRVLQGWVAEAGIQCAQMAQRGITGPVNFLSGHYGFAHLYGRGTLDAESVTRGLGETWKLENVVFKKYPSCGVTQGATELALGLVSELGLRPSDIREAVVRLPPYAHRLVGHPFRIGANPRVDAQFNAAYCVANAFVRQSSLLRHFAPSQVNDAAVREMIGRIEVISDETLDARGHAAVDLVVTTNEGAAHLRQLDIPPGFPGAELDDVQHLARFSDCLTYAPRPPSGAQAEQFLQALEGIAALPDIRALVPMLIVR